MTKPVAVITGAASGIGFELAKRLVATHRVAILHRDLAGAERATAAIRAAAGGGAEALPVLCDITDQTLVINAIDAVVSNFGRIDVAVSNAGIASIGTARHLHPEVLAAQLDVSVTGNWRFIHACLPHVIATSGYVLAVASGAAVFGPPSEGLYSASKSALEALLNVVRVEVKHLGVGVGIAYPMFVDTPMLRDGEGEHEDFTAMRKRLPGSAGKTYPVDYAAALLERGVRRRATRIFVPPSLRLQFALKGMLGPLMDRAFAAMVPEIDALTAEKVKQLGAFQAAFDSRHAARFSEADRSE